MIIFLVVQRDRTVQYSRAWPPLGLDPHCHIRIEQLTHHSSVSRTEQNITPYRRKDISRMLVPVLAHQCLYHMTMFSITKAIPSKKIQPQYPPIYISLSTKKYYIKRNTGHLPLTHRNSLKIHPKQIIEFDFGRPLAIFLLTLSTQLTSSTSNKHSRTIISISKEAHTHT